ncbi:MAG: substrate-binding domain-containing protein [Eubacteriales bacterium]|nr:substrate-binding domain-containing protein [Eubacteriales bacterium]
MRCKKCGAFVPDSDRFCSQCGEETGIAQGSQQVFGAQTPQPTAPPVNMGKAGMSKKAKMALWFGGGAFLLLAIAAVMIFLVFPDALGISQTAKTDTEERKDNSHGSRDTDDEDAEDAVDETEAVAVEAAVEETNGHSGFLDEKKEDTAVATEAPMFASDMVIGVVLPAEDGYYGLLAEELVAQMTASGGEIFITSSYYDAAKEWDCIESLIVQGTDAIILVPVADIPLPAIEMAQEAGVAIVLLSDNTDESVSAVGHDYETLGMMAGSLCMEGNVFVINAMQGLAFSDTLETALLDILEYSPEVTVLGIEYSEFNLDKAMVVTEDAMAAYPDIDTVICLDPVSSLYVLMSLDAGGFEGDFICFTEETTLEDIKEIGSDIETVYLYFAVSDIADALFNQLLDMLEYGYYDPQTTYVSPQMGIG